MINQDLDDVVAAFADGELVDPAQLEQALARPEGRAALIDLLVLRGLVAGQPTARPATSASAAPAQRLRSRAKWLTIAAGIAAVSVAGGYAIGTRSATRQPGPAVEITTGAPAPAPTQVIRLENGVDWSERGGGN